MRFDQHLFISYAHLDNQPLIKGTDGWVTQFHRALEIRVDQLLGEKSAVWRDPKLQGNDLFDVTIIEQLPHVAVLVSVLTPRYMQSESCLKELFQFCKASESTGGIQIGGKMRIIKVLKTPIPNDEQPVELRDCLGYEFFKVDHVEGRVRELNHVFGGDIEREFWIKLDDLAQDVCQLLAQLNNGKSTAKTEVAEPGSTVFLASSSFDLNDQYERVKRDLLGHRLNVLPSGPLPLNTGELEPLLRTLLEECQLSVHLIGKSYGIVPEGAERSLLEIQNDLAIEREKKGDFSRIVWMPPNLEVTDERQRRFIDTLRSDPRTGEGADLLETPLEDLNTQIHQTIARRAPAKTEQEPAPAKNQSSDELRCVYLVCDSRDSSKVTPIADYLFDQGCEVLLPAFQGDEAEVRADHEENLRTADGVLIYYGSPNELWLRGKLRESRKSAGQGRTRALSAKAIVVAPPNSEKNEWLRTHEARVIHQKHGFVTNLLDPFLHDLRV